MRILGRSFFTLPFIISLVSILQAKPKIYASRVNAAWHDIRVLILNIVMPLGMYFSISRPNLTWPRAKLLANGFDPIWLIMCMILLKDQIRIWLLTSLTHLPNLIFYLITYLSFCPKDDLDLMESAKSNANKLSHSRIVH